MKIYIYKYIYNSKALWVLCFVFTLFSLSYFPFLDGLENWVLRFHTQVRAGTEGDARAERSSCTASLPDLARAVWLSVTRQFQHSKHSCDQATALPREVAATLCCPPVRRLPSRVPLWQAVKQEKCRMTQPSIAPVHAYWQAMSLCLKWQLVAAQTSPPPDNLSVGPPCSASVHLWQQKEVDYLLV